MRETRRDDLSKSFLLLVKLSFACQLLTLTGHLSHPNDLLPPVCIRYRQSSVVSIVVRCSLTTVLHLKSYCANIIFIFGYCIWRERKRKIVNYMIFNPRGLYFVIKTVKLIFSFLLKPFFFTPEIKQAKWVLNNKKQGMFFLQNCDVITP